MKNNYIPPYKREKNLFGNRKPIEFPKLTTNPTHNNINNNSQWNKKISFSNLLNNSNTDISSNVINNINCDQTDFLNNQHQNKNKLLHLTFEQSRRDQINNDLQDESPYWNVKNLLDPDSDNSEDEYDVNKDNDVGNNLGGEEFN
jgi:hypothetical protein